MAATGIRELKANLSEYLRQVETGKTVVITRRGKPIGRIVPATQSVEARLDTLIEAGLVAWNRQRLQPQAPVARAGGERTVADLLLEDRE